MPVLTNEDNLDLQFAIDKLAETVRQRLDRYFHLESRLHLIFDEREISAELVRYFEGMEVANAGVTRWTYESPRKSSSVCSQTRLFRTLMSVIGYFRDVDASRASFVDVELFCGVEITPFDLSSPMDKTYAAI